MTAKRISIETPQQAWQVVSDLVSALADAQAEIKRLRFQLFDSEMWVEDLEHDNNELEEQNEDLRLMLDRGQEATNEA